MRSHLALPLFALLARPAFGSIEYCSSVNTGSSSTSNFSIYQSNGKCETTCADSAFGILQGKNCWCSDIAPNKATNVDLTKCDDGCPGYPDDSCGSESADLFAYIQLGTPSGTATARSTTTTTTTTTKSETSTTSSELTSTTADSTATNSAGVGVGDEATGTNSGDSSQTWSADSDTTSSSDKGSSSVNGGTIAGAVVGAVGGVALIVALIFVMIARRRKRADSPDPSFQGNLLDGRQSKGSRMSFVGGVFSDNHSHTLSAGSSITPQRMPTFTDNRLKTDTVLYANGRRDSSVSLQDNEDYSRPVLRLTNPD